MESTVVVVVETELAKMDRLVNELAHEINVAHNVECNDQARYHIRNFLTTQRNEEALKWSELNIWLRANPKAKVDEIQAVRAKLNLGEDVRGFNALRTLRE